MNLHDVVMAEPEVAQIPEADVDSTVARLLSTLQLSQN
jgi:hypothetical protein